MKKILDKTKLNILVYKVIGIAIISFNLLYAFSNLYNPSEYGGLPHTILVIAILVIYLLLPYILDKVFATLILAFFTVYYVGQACYYKLFDQYIFINSAFGLFEEAKAYTSTAMELITSKESNIILIAIISIVFLWLLRRNGKYNKKIFLPIIIVASIIGVAVDFNLVKKYETILANSVDDIFQYNQSDLYIYDKMPSKKVFVEKFGIDMFLFKDVNLNIINKYKTDNYKEEISTFFEKNLEYQKNSFTGLLEGKSLIIFQGESLTTSAIDPDLTPTLYKLMKDGWDFTNFYSPLLIGSTSDVEVMVNTSLLPIDNGDITSQRYADNAYPVTLAKGFAQNGYTVNAVHNNYGLYYNREIFFPTIGYETFFDSFTLGVDNLSSDLTCQQIMNWIDSDIDKAFTFFVTYSGHQPYTMEMPDTTVEARDEYLNYLKIVKQKYPDLSEDVQIYFAKSMSTDRAIKSLIDTYSMLGKLDDLVIVYYGDHYVKGFNGETRDHVSEVVKKTNSMNDTPLVLWYNGIKSQTVEKYCTDIDFLPTLFNLFNIGYDKSKVLGNDIFDDRYTGFQFTTTWIIHTNEYQYRLESNDFIDLNISEEEARQQVERYLNYQNISNLIIQNDYFNDEGE